MLPDTIVAHHISRQKLTLWNLTHFTDQLQDNLHSKHIACHHVVLYECTDVTYPDNAES
jgi:hypothetical protein